MKKIHLSLFLASSISSQCLLTLYVVTLIDLGMTVGWIMGGEHGGVIGCVLTVVDSQFFILLIVIRIKVIVKKFKNSCVLAIAEDLKKTTFYFGVL